MKVRMVPHLEDVLREEPSGIRKVVEKYFEHLPKLGVELVAPNATSYDLLAIHAGAKTNFAPNDPVVLHCHGVYWTDDQAGEIWEHQANAAVIHTARHAKAITVPSEWVAEVFRRDMHLNPWVIPHGVDWEEWQGGTDQGYILWNKNRDSDVCDPSAVTELARRLPGQKFVTTFANGPQPANVRVTGQVPHERMKQIIKGASLYLATVKETFGIGTLEALAAGVPVLGWELGNTKELVVHGRTGYLALPGDYQDLEHGAKYLLRHRGYLSRNASDWARVTAPWDLAAQSLAAVYQETLLAIQAAPRVAVVIPCYNKAETLERAVMSCVRQKRLPDRVIVVNNNSTDNFPQAITPLLHYGIEVANCEQQGVAHARNHGIALADDCQYICCLDADDEIKPTYLEVCLNALQADNALGIAYTGLEAVNVDGSRFVSAWPHRFDYENFIVENQVPTAAMFRRSAWQRAGGYRQRYASPAIGAGAEDANFFLRLLSLGFAAKKVTDEPLFVYHLGGTVSSNPDYREPDWRAGFPWAQDKRHPFASVATPNNGIAHRVRQYDEPLVSVVIPVGPGHAPHLVDCLDSLEGQTNRQWEAIVVADVPKDEWDTLQRRLDLGYSWARLLWTTDAPQGAGVARNLGASHARAPLLLFVDADDWLTPNALNILLEAYADDPFSIVYGQYLGHAFISDRKEIDRYRQSQRLVAYDEKTTEATILYDGQEFDCERAMAQPDGRRPYIWNVITSLVPKAFHEEIGGFDTRMKSWEDWDYWLRMARTNHCFTRVAKPVLEYRFYTGRRRALANPTESGEDGRQLSASLLEYMQAKYREERDVPGCSSCGGRRRPTPTSPVPMQALTIDQGGLARMSSEDFVQVELVDGNVGNHRIVFQRQDYGYRSHGDRFLMRAVHARADRRVRILETVAPSAAAAAAPKSIAVPAATRAPLPEMPQPPLDVATKVVDDTRDAMNKMAPQPAVVRALEAEPAVSMAAPEAVATPQAYEPPPIYDFTLVWGIGQERANELVSKGFRSLAMLVALNVAGIQQTLGVPQATAERIFASAKELSRK